MILFSQFQAMPGYIQAELEIGIEDINGTFGTEINNKFIFCGEVKLFTGSSSIGCLPRKMT